MVLVLQGFGGFEVEAGFTNFTSAPDGTGLGVTRIVATRQQGRPVAFWQITASDGTWYAAETNVMRAVRDTWARIGEVHPNLGLVPAPDFGSAEPSSSPIPPSALENTAGSSDPPVGDAVLRLDLDPEVGTAMAALAMLDLGDPNSEAAVRAFVAGAPSDVLLAAVAGDHVDEPDSGELPEFVSEAIREEVHRAFFSYKDTGCQVSVRFDELVSMDGWRISRTARTFAFACEATWPSGDSDERTSAMVVFGDDRVAFYADVASAAVAAHEWVAPDSGS
jgi:hypothetical protein